MGRIGNFEPVSAALSRSVRRGQSLAHDALETLLLRRFVQHLPVVVRRGHLPGDVIQSERFETQATLRQRERAEVLTVVPQQVEGDQGHRVLLRQPSRPAGVPDVHPVGEGSEGRHSLAQGDHLAVDQEVVAERREGVQLGEGDSDIVLVARPDAESALGAVHEDAHAVPLHLVGPARTGHVVALGGEHRQHTAIQAGAGSVSSAPHHLRGILITCVQSGRVPSPSAWSASR